MPQLSSGQQHNYSTKTRQAGWANEQSMNSLMSMKILKEAKVSGNKTRYFYKQGKYKKSPQLKQLGRKNMTSPIKDLTYFVLNIISKLINI